MFRTHGTAATPIDKLRVEPKTQCRKQDLSCFSRGAGTCINSENKQVHLAKET